MDNADELASLLRESIAASNRTTRAVRAFVRFLFIQLSATTLAGILVYFGATNENLGLVVIGVLVLLVGVIWSSSAGWEELEKSDPDKFENRALTEKQVEEHKLQEQQRLDAYTKAEAARMVTEEKRRKDAEASALKKKEENRALRLALLQNWRYRIMAIAGAVAVLILAAGFYVRSSPSTAAQICAQLNGEKLPPWYGERVLISGSGGTFECTMFVLSGYIGISEPFMASQIPSFPFLVERQPQDVFEISPR